MNAPYEADRAWSDKFIPQIKRLVGPHLLEAAPFDRDATEATDLIVLTARDMRIAARVRRHGYADKYPYEITIRSKRDTGAETELSKIENGWGDWLFYGHADQADSSINRWWLVDLNSFRAGLIRHGRRGCKQLSYTDKCNGDGTYFVAIDLRSFPKQPPILVASSHVLNGK